MFLKILLAAFLVCPASVLSAAQPAWLAASRLPAPVTEPAPGDDLRVTVHRLKNGLTVYLSPNKETPRISAWIAVRAGSRHDPSDSTGMAHYLEHMFFKGSEKLGTLDYSAEKPHLDAIRRLYEEHFVSTDTAAREAIYRRIDEENVKAARFAVPNEYDRVYKSLGFRNINAFTSNDMTVYIADFPKNRIGTWAELESDRFARPVFRLFQSEIETVYEEKNRSMDNAWRILNEALDKALFGDHPYGRTTLGSVEHLKNPSLAKLYDFVSVNYIPNNMAIALAGDFDRKEALKVIEKRFGAWNPKPVTPPQAAVPPAHRAPERVEVKYESEEQVSLAWPMPSSSDPDADALEVMGMVMSNSGAGIVDLALNQAQKVKQAGSSMNLMNEGGSWELWAVPKDSQTLEEAEALLLGTVASLKSGAFTDEDLKAIVTNYEIEQKMKLESNDARVAEMAMSFLSFQEWPRTAGRLERIKKVTRADVLRVAEKYLGDGRVAAYRRRGKPELPLIQKPGFTKIDIARGRESRFFKKLVEAPARPIEPRWLEPQRDYAALEAPFGRLVAVRNPFNDLFALDFYFDRGSGHERTLCAALDLLELSGAGDMTAEDFKKRLYSLGASMNVYCGERTSMVRLSGLERNLEESLRLMELRFGSPRTAPDTLKDMIKVQIGAHKDNKVNPSYVSYALGEWAQRGKESRVLQELSDEELKGLDESALKDLLRTYFSFKRRVGYVGSRSGEEVLRLLTSSDRKYSEPPARRPLVYRRPAADEAFFTHRDMVQSQIGLFAADEKYDPASAVDYGFYADYMGGGMSAVIFQEVREARSMAYAASGGYMTAAYKGEENVLWGRVGTQADKTLDAASLIKDLLTRMPAAADRFKAAKRSIEERYRTSPVEFRSVAGALFAWEDLGLSGDPRPERFKRSLSYTLDELTRFAARFEKMPKTVYILGNRERVDPGSLKKLGTVTEKPLDELFPY